MLLVVEIMGAILASGWIVLIVAIMRAPEGYEDEQGFHPSERVEIFDFESGEDDFELLREYVARCDAQHDAEAQTQRQSASAHGTPLGVHQ